MFNAIWSTEKMTISSAKLTSSFKKILVSNNDIWDLSENYVKEERLLSKQVKFWFRASRFRTVHWSLFRFHFNLS